MFRFPFRICCPFSAGGGGGGDYLALTGANVALWSAAAVEKSRIEERGVWHEKKR